MRNSLCSTLAFLAFLAGTAQAQIAAGSDLLTTPAGSTVEMHFHSGSGGVPLPAGFFGPGSDPFDGIVMLHGRPLEGTPGGGPSATGIPGQADTIWRRTATATAIFPGMCPQNDTVPIELVALSLVSIQPLTVTFNGGVTTTSWIIARPRKRGSAPR